VEGGVLWTSLTMNGVKHEIVKCSMEEFITTNSHCTAILGVEPRVRNSYHGLLTCVTYVKSILGMDNWLVQRPRQLYKELLKWDALVIKPYTPWLTNRKL
jgi:hypothetical protein